MEKYPKIRVLNIFKTVSNSHIFYTKILILHIIITGYSPVICHDILTMILR